MATEVGWDDALDQKGLWATIINCRTLSQFSLHPPHESTR